MSMFSFKDEDGAIVQVRTFTDSRDCVGLVIRDEESAVAAFVTKEDARQMIAFLNEALKLERPE